jgi:sugar phosphate isomerase/epimerase
MRLGMVSNLYHHEMKQKNQENFAYLVQKAKSLGISVISGGVRGMDIDEARRLLDESGIELESGWAYNYCTEDEEEHKRRRESFEEFLKNRCKPLNVKIVGTCATVTHRWLSEPPLDEQLDRMSQALKPLAIMARDYGVSIALENHADYRGHEIARIIDETGQPNLGARLDTGNPFWTFEEPVDAAEALAPMTITTHIKDMKVDRFAKWEGVPLGKGHVNFEYIIGDLLVNQAPDPDNLSLVMEVEAIQNMDPTVAADESAQYLKEKFGHLLI